MTKRFIYVIVSILLTGLSFILIIHETGRYEETSLRDIEKDRVCVILDSKYASTKIKVYTNINNSFNLSKDIQCEDRGITRYKKHELQMLELRMDLCFRMAASMLPGDKTVPLHFAGIDGMQMLKIRDPEHHRRIWGIMQRRIAKSDFKLGEVAIDDDEKIKWAWVAANYLKGTLQSLPSETSGVIALGDRSLQIAFEETRGGKHNYYTNTHNINGKYVSLNTQALICYGTREAKRLLIGNIVKLSNYSRIIKSPCFLTGFTKVVSSKYISTIPCSASRAFGKIIDRKGVMFTMKGTGNANRCYNDIKMMMTKKCSNSNCPIINRRSRIRLKGNFLATGAFYELAQNLGLNSIISKKQFWNATQMSCAMSTDPSKLSTHEHNKCLTAVYSYYLLHTLFGYKKEKWDVEFIKQINGTDVGLDLGLLHTNKESMYQRMVKQTVIAKNPEAFLLIIFGIICLCIGLMTGLKGTKTRDR